MFRFANDSIAEYDMQLYVLQLEGVEIRQYEYECQLLATITNFQIFVGAYQSMGATIRGDISSLIYDSGEL